jgi:hypothetical protein
MPVVVQNARALAANRTGFFRINPDTAAYTKSKPRVRAYMIEHLDPNLDPAQPSLANPFINPERLNWVPDAIGSIFDAVLDKGNYLRPSFSPDRRFSGPRRGRR